MALEVASFWSDVPVGDMSVIHPATQVGHFNVTVPANGSVLLRHEIMGNGAYGAGVADASITANEWMILMTPILSWQIVSLAADLSLVVRTRDILSGGAYRDWKGFLVKGGDVHRMDNLHCPAANVVFSLRNSDAAAAHTAEGFIRCRSI